MTRSHRRWDKSEKLLLLSPLLILLAWFVAARPRWIMERMFGWPRILKMPEGTMLRAIALSADGRILAAGGPRDEQKNGKSYVAKDSGDVYLWDTRTGQVLNKIPTRLWRDKRGHLRGFDIWGLALSPDGTTLTRGLLGDKFCAFNVKTGKQISVLPFFAWRAVFSPDGKLLAGLDDDKIRIWNVAKREIEHTLVADSGIDNSDLEFSPDGKVLACIKSFNSSKALETDRIADNGPVQLWDVKTGRLIRVLTGDYTVALSFSADGRHLVSAEHVFHHKVIGAGASSGRIRLFDVKTGQVLWSIEGKVEKGEVFNRNYIFRDIAFAPDGKSIAVDNWDSVITLFDASDGRVIKRLKPIGVEPANIMAPPSLAFSGDGKLLVSRAKDTVLLWDIKP